jgi:hypothetical protein
MRRAVLVFSSLALAACIVPPSAAQRLSEAAYEFNTAARWGRMDLASERVREVARDEFARQHKAWGKSIRIVDIELGSMSIRKDGDADVFIVVNWQHGADTTMRSTDVAQRWTSTRGEWTMISEEERGGDKGLIGEAELPKGDDAIPPAPGRSRYQTRVIYEQ